ncbi:MAG: cob(I)yrinic acid a,c-diamide adenosyltransferase [Thermodesulfobacteriota bacterium]
MNEQQGLVIVNTGNGKGKTTAAMGQALRAVGHGMRVCVIQFIKAQEWTGEAMALRQAFHGQVEFHVTGSGFTWTQEQEQVREAALQGWRLAREKIESDAWELVVLEELTYLISLGVLPEEEVLAVLRERPARLHVVITGRHASQGLIDYADLVSEMREIKHPYHKGIKGRKGIEF